MCGFVMGRVTRNFPPAMHRVYGRAKVHSASAIRTVLNILRSRNCVIHSTGCSHTVGLSGSCGSSVIPLINGVATNGPVLTIKRVRSCVPCPSGSTSNLFTLGIIKLDVGGTNVLSNSVVITSGGSPYEDNSVIINVSNSRTAIGHLLVGSGGVVFVPRGRGFSPVCPRGPAILNGIINDCEGC